MDMPTRRLTITEKVLEKVKATPPRHKTWFDRLDASHQSELADIRRGWQAGDIKSSAVKLASHISTTLREDGISTVGIQGVLQWLRNRD